METRNEAKRVLIIGRSHLKYYARRLNMPAQGRTGRYEGELLYTDKALKMLRTQKPHFDAIIVSLYEEHGGELDAHETELGFLTGAVIIRKLAPLFPDTKFFLFGGKPSQQNIVKASDNIILLEDAIEITPGKLLEILDAKFFGRTHTAAAAV